MSFPVIIKKGKDLKEGDIILSAAGRMFAVDINPHHTVYENYAFVTSSPMEIWVTEVSYSSGNWDPISESHPWDLGDGTRSYMTAGS